MNPPVPAEHVAVKSETRTPGNPTARREHLRHMIEHAAHLLPSQGPITVFVHHNTLHAFEDSSFEAGLRQGSKTHGCEPYLTEDYYRQCLVTGRILQNELAEVLTEDLGDQADTELGAVGTRFSLRMAMLQHPVQSAPRTELRWLVAESDALRRFHDSVHGPMKLQMVAETRHWVMRDLRNGNGAAAAPTAANARVHEHVRDLFSMFGKSTVERWNGDSWESFCLHLIWRLCLDGSRGVAVNAARRDALPIRHADLLEAATHESCDPWVNELLIRFCAAFLDQGYAHWRLPDREQGFFRSFTQVYGQRFGPPDRWLRGLRRELDRLRLAGTEPLDSIDESLNLLGVDESEHEAFISETLQALPGWAGMIWQMETNAEWTLFPAAPGTLVEYLAVRLILDRLAAAHLARQSLRWRGELGDLRDELRPRISGTVSQGFEERAFLAFQLSQVCGWSPQTLNSFSDLQWRQLINEIEAFPSLERRRILHRAYERRYVNQTLDAISSHCRRRQPWAHESSGCRELAKPLAHPADSGQPNSPHARTPAFQLVCCIDEREESFRRHLEEVEPACETFGTAGFFGVAMYYRSASDAHPRPLCPIVIKPQHYVNEEVAQEFEKEHLRRAGTRRALGAASHRVHLGTRTFLGGVLTSLGGSLASIPMVTRVLFPRGTAQFRRLFAGLLRPPAATQLTLERTAAQPGPEEGHVGYSLEEMAAIVERFLRDIGLTRYFAPVIIVAGHGSSSLNNPHESAYNCGACSGGRGGPNARALAQMANDLRIREMLAARGLLIPSDTTFIGAFHNTCDDSMTYFDLDRLPPNQKSRVARVSDAIDEARRRNSHERCRRFESAPLNMSFESALRHVEGRAEDLSQARPEYNHATNALCFVGHRWWSRGLFVDRRSFLQSYDPRQDDEQHTILARILGAVIPVCGGISLEYYFSCVDPTILGCGSKLPHNITSLLGVMEGAASDLRPGLSEQMVEIHEPMRIMFLIETSPEAMLSIMDRNPVIARLCRNEWVQVAVLDTDANTIHVFRGGEFKPYQVRSDALPRVASSLDWYRGWRDHLGFAVIQDSGAS